MYERVIQLTKRRPTILKTWALFSTATKRNARRKNNSRYPVGVCKQWQGIILGRFRHMLGTTHACNMTRARVCLKWAYLSDRRQGRKRRHFNRDWTDTDNLYKKSVSNFSSENALSYILQCAYPDICWEKNYFKGK